MALLSCSLLTGDSALAAPMQERQPGGSQAVVLCLADGQGWSADQISHRDLGTQGAIRAQDQHKCTQCRESRAEGPYDVPDSGCPKAVQYN